MTAEYDDLRYELEYTKRRFQEVSNEHPDLGHLVCHCEHEVLSEIAWAAFKQHNNALTDGRWHDWRVSNNGKWCGRIHGNGSLLPKFEALAEETVSLLERMSKLSGAGELFFVALPPEPVLDTWLRLLYDTSDLYGVPKAESGSWNVSEGHKAPAAFHTYWSKPDMNGMSYPMHPQCLILSADVFTSSVQALDSFLTPPLPHSEYLDLIPYSDEGYIVPPYLPDDPWEVADFRAAIAEALKEQEKASFQAANSQDQLPPSAVEQPSGEESARPFWDKADARLYLGDLLLKEFQQDASRQEELLQAFQEAGWPSSIENPFLKYKITDVAEKARLAKTSSRRGATEQHVPESSDLGDMTPERCLSNTLYDLNRSLGRRLLEFKSRRGGVTWRRLEASTQSSD